MNISRKVKFRLEFAINVSPQMLYQYISTPAGLSEWYADNVDFTDDIFTFRWDDGQEQAKLVRKKLDEVVKFRWLNTDDDSFFEMKIVEDEITNDVSLVVIDFSEPENHQEAKMLWESQIADLKHRLGVI